MAAVILAMVMTCQLAATTTAISSSRGKPTSGNLPVDIQLKDGFVYATAAAQPVGARRDKAADRAFKKARLRALAILSFYAGCREIADSLKPGDRAVFLQHFKHLGQRKSISSIRSDSKKEKDGLCYYTIKVPAAALEDIQPDFTTLDEAVNRYLAARHYTARGLDFCLRHTWAGSGKYRLIYNQVSDFFSRIGTRWASLAIGSTTASCCVNKTTIYQQLPIGATVRGRLMRAGDLCRQAEERIDKAGDWETALSLVTEALELFPGYAPGQLIISRYLLVNLHAPAIARLAAEQALAEGLDLQVALDQLVACLEAEHSPEREVYGYLLKRMQKNNLSNGTQYPAVILTAWPNCWDKREMERLGTRPTATLVLGSLGRILPGPSSPPATSSYQEASDLYQKSNSRDDIRQVLKLLFDALEAEPLSAQTHNFIGTCYRNLDQPSLALPFLWQALELKPDFDLALTNLALCCKKLECDDSARYYISQPAVVHSSHSWVQKSGLTFQADKE